MSASIYRPIPDELSPDRIWLEFGNAVRLAMSADELAEVIRVCLAARTYYEDGGTGDVPMYPEDAQDEDALSAEAMEW